MNICFVSKEYPPERHVGGIATYTHNVAHCLSRLGHNVHVLTTTAASPGMSMDKDVVVHRLPQIDHKYRSLGYVLHSMAVSLKLHRLAESLDIVQVSEWSGEGFWFSLRPTTVLVSRLATPSFLLERLSSSGVRTTPRITFAMERLQVKGSAGVISSTSALARVVCDEWRMPITSVKIIPNSVDLDWIRSFRDTQPSILQGPSMLPGKEYLLYYGRLEERKGVHVLAEALPAVLTNWPNVMALFVGADGDYKGSSMRRYVETQCSAFADRVRFLDSLPQSELFPLVAHAKMVILPSLWEAFGFVCVEAMALGRPVVASAGSGFEEIIRDGVSGFLVEPGNPSALQARITWCLERAEEVARIGQQADERANDFNVNNVGLALVQYYRSLLQSRRASRLAGDGASL